MRAPGRSRAPRRSRSRVASRPSCGVAPRSPSRSAARSWWTVGTSGSGTARSRASWCSRTRTTTISGPRCRSSTTLTSSSFASAPRGGPARHRRRSRAYETDVPVRPRDRARGGSPMLGSCRCTRGPSSAMACATAGAFRRRLRSTRPCRSQSSFALVCDGKPLAIEDAPDFGGIGGGTKIEPSKSPDVRCAARSMPKISEHRR